MLCFRRSPLLRRVILPLTLLAFLSACHKWVPLEPPVAQAVAEEEPGTVRVTLADGSQVVLKEPHISGDSLVAFEDGKEPQTVALLLEDVRQAEVQRTNKPATVGLVFGIAVVTVAAVVFLVFAISCDWEYSECFGGN
jgi:hypothetical protein